MSVGRRVSHTHKPAENNSNGITVVCTVADIDDRGGDSTQKVWVLRSAGGHVQNAT